MLTKKRKCRLGRTKTGKCRKTKKSRSSSGLSYYDNLSREQMRIELQELGKDLRHCERKINRNY